MFNVFRKEESFTETVFHVKKDRFAFLFPGRERTNFDVFSSDFDAVFYVRVVDITISL